MEIRILGIGSLDSQKTLRLWSRKLIFLRLQQWNHNTQTMSLCKNCYDYSGLVIALNCEFVFAGKKKCEECGHVKPFFNENVKTTFNEGWFGPPVLSTKWCMECVINTMNPTCSTCLTRGHYSTLVDEPLRVCCENCALDDPIRLFSDFVDSEKKLELTNLFGC